MAKQKQDTPRETREGYEIQATGVYYSLDSSTGIKTKKHYRPEKFQLPKVVKYKQGMKKEKTTQDDGNVTERTVPDIVEANALQVAPHIIRRFYIEDRLREKYPDFTGVHTMEIFSKERIQIDLSLVKDLEKTPIKDMTLSELNQFVTLSDINVTLNDFSDLGDKKWAVERAMVRKKEDDEAAGHIVTKTAKQELLDEPESSLLG